METLLQDIRYGFRTLLKSPGFSIVAIVVLALGIGANSAIFSVVNAVLLRPLPYADPDQLVLISHHYPSLKLNAPVTVAGFIDYKGQTDVFEIAAAYSGWSVNLAGEGEPERILGRVVSSEFFPTLKVGVAQGRLFTPEDDKPGNNQVVILSHGLWQRRYGADPGIVGKTVMLNGQNFVVIGILPANFAPDAFGRDTEIYTTFGFTPQQMASHASEFLGMVARLKPGINLEQAQTHMGVVASRVKQQLPDGYPEDWNVAVRSLNEDIVGDIRPHLMVLLGAVAFVLLIACANVANLMLARATARHKEIAIRTALGASRWRVMKQLLTESLLLSIIGGGLGLLLALWGVDLLISINNQIIPRAAEIGVDPLVIGFTLGVSLLTGIIFGLAPAFQASRISLNETLKEGGRGTFGSLRQRRLRSYLIVSEIALALILLVGAGLMVKSFVNLLDVSPGFRTDNVLTMQTSLPASRYTEPRQVHDFYRRAIEQIKAVPGVERAAVISNLPLSGSVSSGNFTVEGRPPLAPGELSPHSDRRAISPDYFQVMAIPMIKGRHFGEQDSADASPVVIIDETLARAYWPDEDPVGKRLSRSSDNDGNPIWSEIVGVVGAVKHIGLDGVVRGQMYIAHAQQSRGGMYFAIHTSGDPAKMVSAVKGAIQTVDKDQPLYNIRTMDDYLSGSVSRRRFSMMLFGIFAAVALVLAGVGIYGVMSYLVNQRTHEIGVRMALGAQASDVVKMIVGHGLALTLVGVGLGLAGAFALTRVMSSLLFGVSATDPVTFIVIPLVLTGVALGACFVPARRAMKVDPMVALRYE